MRGGPFRGKRNGIEIWAGAEKGGKILDGWQSSWAVGDIFFIFLCAITVDIYFLVSFFDGKNVSLSLQTLKNPGKISDKKRCPDPFPADSYPF